ncbi:MAG: lysine--tRNA ligase [Chthonomonadales bacterium]
MEELEQRAQRIAWLQELRARGIDPYAVERYPRTATAQQILADDQSFTGVSVRAAGRLVAVRIMGKASFAHIQDETGRIQIYVKRDVVGDDAYERFKQLHIGDILGVEGEVFRTRTGEITIQAASYTLLALCFRPLPIGKERDGRHYSGLQDVELRYRMRYVDLLANPEARAILVKRIKLVQAIRRYLDSRGFLEVETPVLQAEAGGAAARPFRTHHNALDTDFKLRISLELYLKRLIVGGFEKVYEIGRVFRNEGISTRHNPEFTLLELYQAYANLEDMEDLVEDMYVAVATAVNGSPRFLTRTPGGAEVEVDFSQRPWPRIPILEGIRRYASIEPQELADLQSARSAAARAGLCVESEHTLGGIIEKLHEHFTQPHLIHPTFITDFPVETSPLAKKHPDNPSLTRRFEVYAATQELGNAFSEINDPLDQRERFANQLAQRAAGDEEAHPMDEDFIRALEYGMPPTGGLGIGIDRLAMVLTGASSIRDVIFFPLLRPERSPMPNASQ